ncbi:MAG: hypothetical protein ABIP39_15500 [Polyangiaceae bacterium]
MTSPETALRSTWLLRLTAACAVIAAAIGLIIAPGLRGNATEAVVVLWDRAAAISAYALCGLLMVVASRGTYDLAWRTRIPIAARIAAISGSGVVIALVIPSLVRRLPAAPAVVLALGASLVAISAAGTALRAPHTRAVAVALAAFSAAALVRLLAWELAVVAGEHASARLYGWSRGVATAGVGLEAIGQLAGAAWLATRTRYLGQAMSSLALGAAFVITWGAARGVHAGAEPWQAALHTALADAPGTPPPYGLSAIATFLVAASIIFALIALVQPNQAVSVTSSLSLALISRGAFDAPLRALSVVCAGVWIILAVSDERAMWRVLAAEREARLAREREAGGTVGEIEAAKIRARAAEEEKTAEPAVAAAPEEGKKPEDGKPEDGKAQDDKPQESPPSA